MEKLVRHGLRTILRAGHTGKYVLQNPASSSTCLIRQAGIQPSITSTVCHRCWLLQVSSFHASCHLSVGKSKNTKRKIVKKITFSPKGSKESKKVVTIWAGMTVQDLADSMDKDIDHVFEVFMYIPGTDFYDDPDSMIDSLNIIKLAVEKSGFRHKLLEKKKTVHKEDKDVYRRPPADPKKMVRRPPVVTIMGHVDHGKTTLLDTLRHSHLVAHEFGGITQHIGAFSVTLPSGEDITFLDTPGHAAFSNMRARGANITDIVVLVVAADDGVMKQTVESIHLALDAEVPIIVAINKIDKAGADVEATKQGLLQNGIQLEDQGGDIQAVPISALKGTNLAALQEAIVVQAELLELKAEVGGMVEAFIIESCMHPGRGKLTTALVQRGTLKRGACVVAGTTWAKVRGMFSDAGQPVQQASPGTAVEMIGWKDLPSAGEEILQVESEHRAREVVHYRLARQDEEKISADQDIITRKTQEHEDEYHRLRQARLASGFRRGAIYKKVIRKEAIETHTGPELAIVLKGDVDGTVEAILDILDTYHSDLCHLHLLSYGVGDITEHDVDMAAAFNGVIYGFNVKAADSIMKSARSHSVGVRHHNIIYKLFDDLKLELSARVEVAIQEEIIGEANVLVQFTVTEGRKKVAVAGCRCVKGSLHKKNMFKLIRDGEVILSGPLQSLKHFKNEVDSIKKDVECGLSFKDATEIPQPGDVIHCYEEKEVRPALEWDLEF